MVTFKLIVSEYIHKGIRTILLNKEAINKLAQNKGITKLALVLLILIQLMPIFAFSILVVQSFIQTIYDTFFAYFNLAINFILIHVLARLFGSKEKFSNFFRAYAFPLTVSILFLTGFYFYLIAYSPLINFIGILVLIWMLVILYTVVMVVYKLNAVKAMALVIISTFVWIVLQLSVYKLQFPF